jgi:exportin-1
MFELKDFGAFKSALRDFLVQTKQFASQDNADLFAEEAAAQREVRSVCLSGQTSSRMC